MSLHGLLTDHAYVHQMIEFATEGHLVEVIDGEGEIVFTVLPSVSDSPALHRQEASVGQHIDH